MPQPAPRLRRRVGLVVGGPDAHPYDHGPRHPLRPERVPLGCGLIRSYGLLDREWVEETTAQDAADDDILLVHTEAYVDAVKRAGRGEEGDWSAFGLPSRDNPVFPHMHEATARVVGASIGAAERVLTGAASHAFNPAGGLHHAMPDRARGFCVYNDPAITVAWLLANGAERVAYLDVDVHHGDGPQAVFWGDPRVLTVSLHETGDSLPPGTGYAHELGGGDALGTKVNVPLPAGTGDDGWLAAFDEVVPPLVEAFRPTVLVTQLGCDTHHTDPLAHLLLTTRAYRETAARVHQLAHSAAGGRWVAMGGGGYQWATVVPRAWAIYFAEMCGVSLPDELPPSWVAQAKQMAGGPVPTRLSEEPPQVSSWPDPAVAEVVAEVKRQVFPLHGLR